MLRINEIQPYEEPRKSIANILDPILDEPEMTEFDSAFLCGLIKAEHPKKIVEIGIAAGSTTAIILQCLEALDQTYEMYSVDFSEKYYRNVDDLPSGFMAENLIRQRELSGKHQILRGGCVYQFLQQIGDEIDLLILDTMHSLPGELLDFLVLFKRLSKSAIVCLHDISLNSRVRGFQYMNATNVLFHSVAGEKLINYIPRSNGEEVGYPNIGAFRINEDTEKYMENVFQALTMSWQYMPGWNDINGYGSQIQKDYRPELFDIWRNAVMMNGRMMYPFPKGLVQKGSRLLLYGAGNVGQEYYRQLKASKYAEVVAWVDEDAEAISQALNLREGTLNRPDVIDSREFDCVVIAIMSQKPAFDIHKSLIGKGIKKENIIWAGKEIYEY